LTRKPVYVQRDLPSLYELTRDGWLRQEPRDVGPKIESLKDGREFLRQYSKCRRLVVELLGKQQMRTYDLWVKLLRFKEVRTYVLHSLLTEGKIAIIAEGYYTSRKKHWYYLSQKLPKEMFVLIVPYSEKKTLKRTSNT
jgi:hypothetical protein